MLPTQRLDLFRLRIRFIENDTYVASVINRYGLTIDNNASSSFFSETSTQGPGGYDDTGALYYVIAVVLMYGCSIVLMIGSSIKKSQNDQGVGKYMKDLDKVKRAERRQEKFKTRLVMYRKRFYKIEDTIPGLPENTSYVTPGTHDHNLNQDPGGMLNGPTCSVDISQRGEIYNEDSPPLSTNALPHCHTPGNLLTGCNLYCDDLACSSSSRKQQNGESFVLCMPHGDDDVEKQAGEGELEDLEEENSNEIEDENSNERDEQDSNELEEEDSNELEEEDSNELEENELEDEQKSVSDEEDSDDYQSVVCMSDSYDNNLTLTDYGSQTVTDDGYKTVTDDGT